MRKNPIKVENWKGRRIIVARDKKGRITAYKKLSKSFNKETASRIYKQNKTFSKTKVRITEDKWKTIEVVDFSKNVRPPKVTSRYQYFVEATLKNGNTVSARSKQYDTNISISVLKGEAYRNFNLRLAEEMGFGYDADEGELIADTIRARIREGVVYYKAKA